MTRVAVVTGHTGPDWDRIAAITMPGLTAYCDRHGYELVDVPLADYADGRPASWGKLPAMTHFLRDADVVVWVDADVVVEPGVPPIHLELDPGAWQALVVHQTPEGTVPGCGVWVVKKCEPVLAMLLAAWDDYRDHPWWEQAAIQRLMGFDPDARPVQRNEWTDLWEHTVVLHERWSALPGSGVQNPYMLHAPGGRPIQEREAMLRRWAKAA